MRIKLLTEPLKTVKKTKMLTVQTCMKRSQIKTVVELCMAPWVSALDLVALQPGCAPSPSVCGAVRGLCIRKQGLFLFVYPKSYSHCDIQQGYGISHVQPFLKLTGNTFPDVFQGLKGSTRNWIH